MEKEIPKKLQKQAEEKYPLHPDMTDNEQFDAEYDRKSFIAGATSPYVESEKDKFAMEFGRWLYEIRGEHLPPDSLTKYREHLSQSITRK